MNEKIKEFAKQAWPGLPSHWWDSRDGAEAVKKFSEMIVGECCNVARRTILLGSGVNPNTFAGTVTTVQEIKKHFGVEE